MKLKDISLEKYKSGELFKAVPQFEILKDVIENDSCHNNDSVYNHTLNVAENLIQIASENLLFENYFRRIIKNSTILDLVIIAALFHDTGKAATFTVIAGETSCTGHEEASYEIVSEFFRKVDDDNSEKEIIKKIVRQHAVFYPSLDLNNNLLEDDFRLFERNLDLYPELLLFCAADIRGSQLRDNDFQSYDFKNSFLCSKLENYLKVRG